MGDAGPTCNGARPAARTATRFAGPAESTQGWVFDGGLIVVRQGQLHEAVKILEHFRIPLDGCLPILVDATLQLRLRRGDLVRVRWCVVIVVGVSRDAVQVCRMCRLSTLGQQPEVLEDVVLGVSPHP
jgi:hypothetical protein